MKLNMSILKDWLSDFQPTATLKNDQLEIETVRLFSKDMIFRRNTLYIGKLKYFFSNGGEKVICTHNNDILLLETEDVEFVLNCVLNAFEYFSKWETDMMALLTSNAMLQDLMNRSESVINRPMFLLDAGQRLLSYSFNHHPHKPDALWQNLIKHGSSGLPYIIKLTQAYPERFLEKDIYSLSDDVFPLKAYHYNFFYQEKWISLVTVIDENNDISKGELSVFSIFCTYLNNWFQSHIQEQEDVLIDNLLRTAISNDEADTGELRWRLNIRGWKNTDKLVFIQISAPYQPFNINAHLCRTLNQNFPTIYAIANNLSICALCNLTQKNWETLEQDLLPWMQTSKYYGTLSPVFTLQDSLYKYYQYTDIASWMPEKKPGLFYQSEPYLLRHIFNEIRVHSPADLRHPELRKLQKYDLEHNTDFAHTLKVYLEKERSPIETAKALNLHRSSLAYRLNRLREVLDVDLDDPFTRLHLLISYELEKKD